jgi:hypothetical protein
MSMTKDQLLAEAKTLNPKDREALIHDLYDLDVVNDLTPEQLNELRRRAQDIDLGICGHEVMRQAREAINLHRGSR